jgi:cytidylate kinase
MIVTIQRELGAGGLTIGEALAADLDAVLLSERLIIEALCARGGFSASYLEKIDECPPTAASSFMADLARATALVQAMEWRSTEHTVVDEVRTLVLEAAEKGNVVVVGHGGPQLLKGVIADDQVFSIMLHAHREFRVRQVQKRWDLSREEATERVRRTDELRRKYLQHFFSADLYDARAYDIVIDTERVGMDAAIEIARNAVRAAMHPVTP